MAGKAGMKPRGLLEVPEKYSPDFIEQMDQRFKVARTLKQRLTVLTNDLSGMENLSYAELSLCRRAIHLERLIEKRELSLSHGGEVDVNSHLAAVNTLASLFMKLGLKRRAKVVGTAGIVQDLANQNGIRP